MNKVQRLIIFPSPTEFMPEDQADVEDTQSTLSIHLDKINILVPLPKPKFGANSFDTMVCTLSLYARR